MKQRCMNATCWCKPNEVQVVSLVFKLNMLLGSDAHTNYERKARHTNWDDTGRSGVHNSLSVSSSYRLS